jgi:hypothetical protein
MKPIVRFSIYCILTLLLIGAVMMCLSAQVFLGVANVLAFVCILLEEDNLVEDITNLFKLLIK